MGLKGKEVSLSDAMECLHVRTLLCEHDGHHVCVDCGALVSPVMRAIEWVPNIDDARQRCSQANDESDDDVEGTCVGVTTLVPYQYGINSKNSKRRVYENGKSFVREVCVSLNLSNATQEEALRILRNMKDTLSTWRGSRRIGIIISCISLACNQLSIGVTDAEILNSPLVNQTAKVMNTHKKIVQNILYKSKRRIPRQADAAEYCLRICQLLNLDIKLVMAVQNACRKATQRSDMEGKAPNVIVAVSILHVLERHNLAIDIMRLCDTVRVTRPTLVKWYSQACYRDLVDTRQSIQKMDTSLVAFVS